MIKKLRKTTIAILLTLSLVINPTGLVFAGNDPGLDAPSASETSPTPEPSPSSSPEPTGSPEPLTSPSPSPSTESSFDGPSFASKSEIENDYYLDDAEKERRWQEYQDWLSSQNPGTKESTGGQDGGGNVGDTSLKTGDANAVGAVVTNANTTAVSTPGGGDCSACPANTTLTNSGNGSGSDNTATANNNNTNTVVIDSHANVNNTLDFDANTGYNESDGNVGNTEIISGDANVVVTVLTNANNVGLDLYQFDVNDNQNGDVVLDTTGLVAQNIGNGSESTNSATINNTNTNIETINNDGNIVNNIDIDANTGKNTASKNTGGDSTIETGDANVVANVVNALNTVVNGAMNVVNIFGDMVGNIVQPTVANTTESSACGCGPCPTDVTASNTGNGTDSSNNTTINNTNTDTTNMTNNATVQNNLDLDATTGGNTTSDNTGGFSTVETGNSNVEANVINIANVNVASGSCDPIYFVFINDVSGGWEGQILGAAPGTYFYTSDGSIYFVDSNGQLVAMNKDNGANSENNTTINNTNTNTTDINNNGTVTNNINIDANTGGNDASKNTGGNSTIKTGDANIAVNVLNFINSNFSGRKVVMTLVNVFGSWLGNFVPAGYTGDVPNPNAQATGGSNSSSNHNNSGSSSNNSSVNSNGGGTNVVSLGGQVLAQGAKNTFKTLVAGTTVENTDGGSGETSESKVPQYRAVQTLDGSGIPVPLRVILIMVPLAALTFVLRKKAAVIASVNK